MGGKLTILSLSPELKVYTKKVFRSLDIDGSNEIDKKETLNYWKTNFAKLNTDQMFKDLDEDGDDTINLEEFINYFIKVKNAGYDEEEIRIELENIEKGVSWAYFDLNRNKEVY